MSPRPVPQRFDGAFWSFWRGKRWSKESRSGLSDQSFGCCRVPSTSRRPFLATTARVKTSWSREGRLLTCLTRDDFLGRSAQSWIAKYRIRRRRYRRIVQSGRALWNAFTIVADTLVSRMSISLRCLSALLSFMRRSVCEVPRRSAPTTWGPKSHSRTRFRE